MEQQPADTTPGPGAGRCAADKIHAATQLLHSAFQDARTDTATLSKAELMEQILATQQLANITWAVQSARLAQVAATEEVLITDSTSPHGVREHVLRHPIGSHQEEFIGAEIGALLGWSPQQATGRVTEATDVITRTPRLFARVGTGELEPSKLAAIHRAMGRVVRFRDDDSGMVSTDLAARVENALLGDCDDPDGPDAGTPEFAAAEQAQADLVARSTSAQAAGRTSRILAALDPVAADRAATRRRRDRVGVFTHPDDEPGLCHLHAYLPSDAAAKVIAAINRHARELHADSTTDKTLSECRADALTDLILANATVTTHLVIQVPVHPDRPTTRSTAGTATADTAAAGTTTAGAAFETGPTACDRTATDAAGWPPAFAHPITGHGTTTADPAVDQDALDREFNRFLIDLYGPGPDADYFWQLQGCSEPPPGIPPPLEPPGPPPPTPEPAASAPATAPSATTPTPVGAAWVGDATVPGVGVIPAAVIQAMTRQFGTTLTRALVDATTGVTAETCDEHYRPSPRLARFIRARDQHCRFPGCSRPAQRCDIDHLIPWPQGPTAAHNLHVLCRHHHRTKQSHGWTVTMTPQGVCTWTSPTGRRYTTTPAE